MTSSVSGPAASSPAAGPTVLFPPLGERRVWVPCPCPWLVVDEERDQQDAYVWRHAVKRAVAAAGIPPLVLPAVTCEVWLATADQEGVPGYLLARGLGCYLPTARACNEGVGDALGAAISRPAAVRLGGRHDPAGVVVCITGQQPR